MSNMSVEQELQELYAAEDAAMKTYRHLVLAASSTDISNKKAYGKSKDALSTLLKTIRQLIADIELEGY
jgi:hypothetical protein